MPTVPDRLDTARLVLRRRHVDDAATFRVLWTERDPRGPAHRRIGPDGRPTVEDIAARIDADARAGRDGLLTVVRSAEGDVIGYCGLLFDGRGGPDEPELAYELLRRVHGVGYATEAAEAVVEWASAAGYRRLWAGVRSWNVASRNVLRKLGFVESGRVEPDAIHGDSLVTVKTLA